MQPRIEHIDSKKLAGRKLRMSLSDNQTARLWQSFMPLRKHMNGVIGTDLYSLQVFPPNYFENFSPDTTFEKWALAEIADFNDVHNDTEAFLLSPGMYAVFSYKGPASGGAEVFQYILQTWLPASDYLLDNRPHFEILGEKYKNDAPDSEEEIWIPVKLKHI
jgi:AraC family transcriptional regulator